MKKNKKLLTFLILIIVLIGCGVPSYFYLGTSYYKFLSSKDSTDDSKINVSISLLDQEQTNKCVNCPSAVVFYWIDTEQIIDTAVLSNISNSFSNKYKKGEPSGGVPLLIYPGDEEAPVVNEYKKATDASRAYRLYYARMKDQGNVRQLRSPTFHARPNASTGATSIDFSIDKNDNNEFVISQTVDGETTEYELVRYNNEKFSDVPTPETLPEYKSTNLDYGAVDSLTGTTKLYVHFCVAFCAASGSFNNIFWSDLYSDNILTFPIN